MINRSSLAQTNILYLEQALELLQKVRDELYSKTSPPLYTSGIGSHIRHDVDHYTNFLLGIKKGKVDYEARQRDPRVESDRVFAIDRIQHIIEQLSVISIAQATTPIQIKIENNDFEKNISSWANSTTSRELDFLLSHTIHHYALIAMILRIENFEPGNTFGVAPSTLRYQEINTSCVQ